MAANAKTAAPSLGACVTCGRAATSLCAACRADAYCGRECQAAAWRAGHRGACAALPAALRGVRLRLPPRGAAAAEASALCRGAVAKSGGDGAKSGGGDDARVFAHPPAARRDLAAYLAALCGPDGGALAVDGALFVQLVAAAEGFLGPAGAGPLPFAVGGGGPWAVLERAARPRLGMLPGYLTAADPAAAALLREVPGGGAWLAGPDLRGRYLGMTARGPARLPLAAWHAGLVAGLRRLPAAEGAGPRLALLLSLGDLGFDDFEVLRAPEA